ncbi:MAG: NTP transferase domain-containing protein [Vicinamibacteria bacterium]
MLLYAILLAAGEGRRIGGPKALLRLGETSFLAHGARLLGSRPGVSGVVGVIGAEAERVRSESGLDPGVTLVVNAAWREGGMLSSALAGLEAAERLGADAVLLHPVDHPAIAPETIDAVIAALLGGARIAVPSFAGRRGHPGGFGRDAFPALRAAPSALGAREVLRGHPEWVVHVPGDAGCIRGIDTREDYAALLRDAARAGDDRTG